MNDIIQFVFNNTMLNKFSISISAPKESGESY